MLLHVWLIDTKVVVGERPGAPARPPCSFWPDFPSEPSAVPASCVGTLSQLHQCPYLHTFGLQPSPEPHRSPLPRPGPPGAPPWPRPAKRPLTRLPDPAATLPTPARSLAGPAPPIPNACALRTAVSGRSPLMGRPELPRSARDAGRGGALAAGAERAADRQSPC